MLFLAVLGGCRQAAIPEPVAESQTDRLVRMLERLPTVEKVEPWALPEYITEKTDINLTVSTRHYVIYTTLSDPLILRQTPVFMESAFYHYREVIGQSIESPEKLKVVFFQNREQWEDYTRQLTGKEARTYLKITAGAYYFKGECVAYNLSRRSNFSILAHEGWHQFSEALFKLRLPAWLDEGLATQFEAYSWQNGRVEFRPELNGSRLFALRQAIGRNSLFELQEILALDAGRVISLTTYDQQNAAVNPQVAAYYAQVYALVRYLRENNYGERREHLQKMLQGAYKGEWPLEEAYIREGSRKLHNPSRLWNAVVGRRIFEQYIATEPAEVEDSYRAFCFKIQAAVRFRE